MKILLNKAHFPVSVLGFGKRIGIWFQGCSIHCPSCCSRDTWEFAEDRRVDVSSLVDWCRDVSAGSIDGITISGGEPFDQPDALLGLLEAFDQWRTSEGLQLDILVYTGYSERSVRGRGGVHLRYIDALVTGPYQKGKIGMKPYCGSDNQQMVVLSQIGETRYGASGLAVWKSGMQVAVDGEGIWMIGIPRRDDLKKFEAGCLKRGLELDLPSWRC